VSRPLTDRYSEDGPVELRNVYRFGVFVVVLAVGVATLAVRMAHLDLVDPYATSVPSGGATASPTATYVPAAAPGTLVQQIAPSRGLIFDAKGNPLVKNVVTYTVLITPADLVMGDSTFADVERTVALRLGAVLNADPIDIQAKVDAQSAKLDALSTRVDALEKIAAGNSTGGTPTLGANPDDLWEQGKAAFGAQRWDEARDAFKKLVVGFPDHPKASQAQYFRAEAYFQQKQYDQAIVEFQKVVDKYGTSDLADDALFREGESAEALLHCTEARAYFGLLGQKYPKSNLVKKAQDKDKLLKKEAKDKTKCSS